MINPIIMKIAHDIRIHLEKIAKVIYDNKLANRRITQSNSGFKHVGILRIDVIRFGFQLNRPEGGRQRRHRSKQ